MRWRRCRRGARESDEAVGPNVASRAARTPTPQRQQLLIATSWTFIRRSAARTFGATSRRLCGTEVAEHHPHELEADRRRVSKEDKNSLEPPFQTAARKREEHVQEDHRRDEVECLPQCEETVVRRPCERGEEGDEAGDDHEGPEAAPGPTPPDERPAEHIGERDPVGQQRDHERLAKLGADRLVRQSQENGESGDRAAGRRDGPERERVRRATTSVVRSPNAMGEAVICASPPFWPESCRHRRTEPLRRDRPTGRRGHDERRRRPRGYSRTDLVDECVSGESYCRPAEWDEAQGADQAVEQDAAGRASGASDARVRVAGGSRRSRPGDEQRSAAGVVPLYPESTEGLQRLAARRSSRALPTSRSHRSLSESHGQAARMSPTARITSAAAMSSAPSRVSRVPGEGCAGSGADMWRKNPPDCARTPAKRIAPAIH